jgi:hypothetical protein
LPPSLLRRTLLAWLAWPALSACQAQPRAAMSPASAELQAQRRRFEGIGLRLIVDAVPGAEMEGVEFFADEAVKPVLHHSSVNQRNKSFLDFPGDVPLVVRVIWRKDRRFVLIPWGISGYFDDFGRGITLPRHQIQAYKDDAQEIAKRQRIAKNTGVVHHGPWGSQYSSEMLGDYTVKVAERIPDAVLADIRRQRGALRLKFRLKPDGVLFGWDIERGGSGVSRFSLAGGDFREAGVAYDLPKYSQPQSPEAEQALQAGGYFLPPKSKLIWRKGWEIKPDGRRVETEY